MSLNAALGRNIVKTFIFVLLSLFVLPAGTLYFTRYVQADEATSMMQAVDQQLSRAKDMTELEKTQRRAFFAAHPPSVICGDNDPELAGLRANICARYSETWQFYMMRKVAIGTIVAGGLLLVAVLVLGALAFANRQMQYLSFVAGWRLTTWASALMVVVQGGMAVWLSFWGTAALSGKYYPKLIIAVGLLVAAGVLIVVMALLRKIESGSHVDGVVVGEADAPVLWQRIRHMAAKLKTEPPKHLVAGIDTNFFVTEAPITVGQQTLTGRTLFVSVPLLRVLDQAEVDAVLGHELAHLRGGDTQSSALLGPKLVQFDAYAATLHSNGITKAAVPLLDLFRMIFELALKSDSREREFKADRVAARLISPQAIAQSLLKIAAYAQYRTHIENELFSRDQRHGAQLGIAQFVAKGLAPYAKSDDFVDTLRTASVPHPFDSHPPMPQRLKNVGVSLPESEWGAVVTRPVQSTWAQHILTADQIEQRLWAAYEENFAAEHERSLAYRYEPANDEEAAIVLKYFPPVQFRLKGGEHVEVSYEGIRTSGDEQSIFWDGVKSLEYKESSFGNALVVTHPDKGMLGSSKTSKIKLPGLGKQKDDFMAAVNHYWQRHQVMRAQQQA